MYSMNVMRKRSLQFQIIIPLLLAIILTLTLTIIITEKITHRFTQEFAEKRLYAESIELEMLINSPQRVHLFTEESPQFLPFVIISEKSSIVFNIDSALVEKIKALDVPEKKTINFKYDSSTYYMLKTTSKKSRIYVLINEKEIPGLKSLSLIKEALIGGGRG